MKDTTPLGK